MSTVRRRRKQGVFTKIQNRGLVLVSVFLVGALALWYSYFVESSRLKSDFLFTARQDVSYLKSDIEHSLEELFSDVLFLSELEMMKRFDSEKRSIENDFIQLMKIRRNYDQVRFLDTLGQEQIRVNYKQGKFEVIETDRLQNKSDRYYFSEVKDLEVGEVYISDVDLNVENGEIERPFKPVLRVATPIVVEGESQGVVVINYDASNLLTLKERSSYNQKLDVTDQILNSEGYWLSGVEANRLFGFRDEDKVETFANVYPEVWSNIASSNGNTIEDEHGVYIYQRFLATDIFEENYGSHLNTPNDPEIILVREIPTETILAATTGSRARYLYISGVYALILILSLFVYNRKQRELNRADVKLKSIFNQTFQFIGMLSPEGELLEVNNTALDFGGFDREDVVGLNFWDCPWWTASIEVQEQLKSAIKTAAQGEFVRYDVEVSGVDGPAIIDFSLRPVKNAAGDIMYIIPEGRDVTENIALRNKLSATNELFEEIQQVAKIGYWRVDVVNMTSFWSDEVYHIHEVPVGTEIDVAKGVEFYREDFREVIQNAVDEAIANNQSWDLEAVIVTTSGKEVWVRAIGYPIIENGEVKELRGLFMDIDEKKKTEVKLSSIFNQTFQFIGMLSPEGVLLEVNDTALDFGGFDREDVVGLNFWDCPWWTASIKVQEQLKSAIKTAAQGEFVRYDVEVSGVDGPAIIDFSLRPVKNAAGDIMYIIPEGRDVTENVTLRDEIKELNNSLELKVEERTRELRDVSSELQQQLDLLEEAAIISITDKNGLITQVNDTFCDISGYSREELIGQNHRILKSGKQPDGIFIGMWAAISKGKIWKGELCNKRKDGSYYWVTTFIKPFKNQQGEIEKYVAVRFDITGLKETQEKLREKSSELQRSNKKLDAANKELETFSYSVSHDLKAPLRALQGFSKNLADRYEDSLDETGLRWLEFIRSNAERMDDLIRDILSFSRIGRKEIQKEEVDMKKIVMDQVDFFKEQYPNELNVQLKDLPRVNGDRKMMEMVWQNLIGNAFKYSKNKPMIDIEISGYENHDYNHYIIKDKGAGFDMKHYDKLFGVFQRLHRQDEFEGTGVGLANVQRIISKHNGEIKGEGEINKGATFEFTIPKN